MIQVAELTDEVLRELGREVGGCSFATNSQKAFLANLGSCDVQAAPGNGKTTLLVAKLALLSRLWTSRTKGVCVISHTNAARFEVEKRLAGHPRAVAFLSYPHFVGTVTTFIDHFIALPYLRGLGWSVRRIDDDVFAAMARARYQAKPTLRAMAQRQQNNVDNWVSRLELSKDFACEPAAVPARLAVVGRPRQPGAHTASGIELEQLKAELTRAGYFRYGDMTAIAHQALTRCPAIIERLRSRFPLVILDEAQDTLGEQLSLLRRVFGEGVAFQLLGDQNQTLYEDADVDPDDCWTPAADAIPMDDTRRFGPDIASFASRLTIRKPQTIIGVAGKQGHRSLLLFDRPSIGRVLPAFAEDIRRMLGGGPQSAHEAWAVASRHNLYRQRGGNWPKSLVDYHAAYRGGAGRSRRPHTLCSMLRLTALKHSAHGLPAEVASIVTQAIAELLRITGVRGPLNEIPNPRNVWRVLASHSGKADVRCRALVFDQAIKGVATWDEATWAPFIAALADIVGFAVPAAGANDEMSRFLSFDEEGAHADADGNARISAAFGDVRIQLGSIHSVKGRTVDSILIVETEVYKGNAAADRTMDLATVLPHAFGLEERNFTANQAQLTAATNIFVGATRARSLLSLAVRKEAVSAELQREAEGQNWTVRDLTRGP